MTLEALTVVSGGGILKPWVQKATAVHGTIISEIILSITYEYFYYQKTSVSEPGRYTNHSEWDFAWLLSLHPDYYFHLVLNWIIDKH